MEGWTADGAKINTSQRNACSGAARDFFTPDPRFSREFSAVAVNAAVPFLPVMMKSDAPHVQKRWRTCHYYSFPPVVQNADGTGNALYFRLIYDPYISMSLFVIRLPYLRAIGIDAMPYSTVVLSRMFIRTLYAIISRRAALHCAAILPFFSAFAIINRNTALCFAPRSDAKYPR